jgi:hypothetical protein
MAMLLFLADRMNALSDAIHQGFQLCLIHLQQETKISLSLQKPVAISSNLSFTRILLGPFRFTFDLSRSTARRVSFEKKRS